MTNKVAVICGNAKVSDFVTADCDSAIRLHQYGLEDDFRVTLGIEGLRGSMYKDVPARLHDFLDIATYVYIADQCVKRGVNEVETFGTTWHRRFKFVVPVKDLEFWDSEATKATLQDCLSFLSDDTYEFVFTRVTDRPLFQAFLNNLNDGGELFGSPDQVMLYSGGLDSLAGVIDEAVNQKRRVLLVNHRSTQKIDKKYAILAAQLEAKCKSNPPQHMRVTVHKKKWMNAEYTQRARSFLYAALSPQQLLSGVPNRTHVRDAATVRVHYQSATTVPIGGIVGFNAPLGDPDVDNTALARFVRDATIQSVRPIADDHTGRFGVAIEPIAEDKVGRVVFVGR